MRMRKRMRGKKEQARDGREEEREIMRVKQAMTEEKRNINE